MTTVKLPDGEEPGTILTTSNANAFLIKLRAAELAIEEDRQRKRKAALETQPA